MLIKTIRHIRGNFVYANYDPATNRITLNINTPINLTPARVPHLHTDHVRYNAQLAAGNIGNNAAGAQITLNPIQNLHVSTAWVFVSGQTGGRGNWIIDDPLFPVWVGLTLRNFLVFNGGGAGPAVAPIPAVAGVPVVAAPPVPAVPLHPVAHQWAISPPPYVAPPVALPTLLNPVYPPWIQLFPVGHHYIQVTAGFWQGIFNAAGQLPLWNTIFLGAATVQLTRDRLLHFPYTSNEQKCAEILIWGYPNNQRRIPANAFHHIAQIAATAPIAANWPNYYHNLNHVRGIGISTITKFAYFYSHVFAGMSSLILDQRLINNTALWAETYIPGLAYPNASGNYLNYLHQMHNASAGIGCTAEQLELFLFTFGANI